MTDEIRRPAPAPQEVDCDVVVIGAGPVGLVMAAELIRRGLRVRLLDAAPAPSPYCRAIGVTSRSLEIFDAMGLAQRMADAGLWLSGAATAVNGAPPEIERVDLSDLPFASLGIPQPRLEAILEAHLTRLGGRVELGETVSALSQDGRGVTVSHTGPDAADQAPRRIRAAYAVGCDGAHSVTRHALGLGFEGEAFPWPFMLGDVHMAPLAPGGPFDLPRGVALRALQLREDGPPDMFIAIPLPEHGRFRVSMLAEGAEPDLPEELEPPGDLEHGVQSEGPGPSLAALQAVADRLMPGTYRLSDLRWSSRYRISIRLAEHYGKGRIFLAGDACHIHPPTGGQGMNTGIQDAWNLAWKLALAAKGLAGPGLLHSYEAERQPVALDVIERTVAASVNLGRQPAKPDRLEDTQIRVSYHPDGAPKSEGPLPPSGPRAGDRGPDATGLRRRGLHFPQRLFEILRGAEFTVLWPIPAEPDALAETEVCAQALAETGLPVRILAIAPGGADLPDPFGVTLLTDEAGDFARAWALSRGAPGQASGPASGGEACLLRPDGHLAWRGRPSAEALVAALRAAAGF